MASGMSGVKEYCAQLGCDIREGVPLAGLTSFKIGGPADLVITVSGPVQMEQVWTFCRERELDSLLIGNGSNLLAGDRGFRGVVLRMDDRGLLSEVREDGLVLCTAGLPLKRLCAFARDKGLSGLEFAYGIPGTVGGGIYMNAGAYGGQMADVLEWAQVVYPEGATERVRTDELAMGYRHTALMDSGAVVTAAAFRLKPGDRSHIAGVMDGILHRRRTKQPLEFPSAGSFFKRPPGQFAGALIEQSGLKGYAVGGAQVSEKHAGFIINRQGATCDDVRRLADHVIETVRREHSVTLEPEVQYIGE